jgi:hypothetical protein
VELGLFDSQTAPLSEPEAKRFGEWSTMSDDERHKESMRMAIHAAMIDRVDQFELASSILDELARAGELPVSDDLKQILDARIKEADDNPESLISAQEVFDELAGD